MDKPHYNKTTSQNCPSLKKAEQESSGKLRNMGSLEMAVDSTGSS